MFKISRVEIEMALEKPHQLLGIKPSTMISVVRAVSKIAIQFSHTLVGM